jgi:hypothetical protein
MVQRVLTTEMKEDQAPHNSDDKFHEMLENATVRTSLRRDVAMFFENSM